jgi:hypothetical protein
MTKQAISGIIKLNQFTCLSVQHIHTVPANVLHHLLRKINRHLPEYPAFNDNEYQKNMKVLFGQIIFRLLDNKIAFMKILL